MAYLLSCNLRHYLIPIQLRSDAFYQGAFLNQPKLKQNELPEWLLSILLAATKNVSNHFEHVKNAFVKEVEVLRSHGIVNNDAIHSLNIKVGDSDLHDEGKYTLILKTNDDRVLHKSRDGYGEELLRKILLATIESDMISVPQLKLSGSELWQKFIYASPLIVDDSLLFELGKFIGIAQLLGLVDLHPENLISASKKIYIVDGETIFHPIDHDKIKKVNINNKTYSVGQTPLSTSLLPTWSLDLKTKRPKLSKGFIGEIFFEENFNDIKFREKLISLLKGYNELITNINYMIDVITDLLSFNKSFAVRRVQRATMSYAIIVNRAVSNTLKNKSALFENELRRLLCINTESAVLDQEIDSLLRGDIPKFTEEIRRENVLEIIKLNSKILEKEKINNKNIIVQSINSLFWSEQLALRAMNDNNYYNLSVS